MNIHFLMLQGSSPGGGSTQIMFFLMIIAVFVFFIIIPNFRRQKELRKFRTGLQKGDKILTTGGIYGKIVEIKDQYVIIEVEDKSRMRVDKSAVIRDMSDVAQGQKK